jgi:gamma-aminobutyric acid type B receptor
VDGISVYVPYEGGLTLRNFNSALSGGISALICAGAAILLFAIIMLAMFWNSFSTLGSFLSSVLITGILMGFASAAVLLPKPTNELCVAFPWLLGVAFVLVYGCLFIKTWALYRVWSKAVKYQRTNLTPGYIVKCLSLGLSVEIVFLIIWTVVDPPRASNVTVVNNTLERQCDTDHPTFWIIFLAAKGVWLVFGAVLSILTRNIAKENNESTTIAYAIYNITLLLAIAIPLAMLLNEVPGGRLVIEVVVIVMAFTFTMIVVFFGIWHRIILPEKVTSLSDVKHASKHTTDSSSATKSAKSSKSSNSDQKSATLSAAASEANLSPTTSENPLK